MNQKSINQLIPAQKIDLFTFQKQGNPEEIATTRLLEISDENDDFDPLEHDFPPKQQKEKNNPSERSPKSSSQLRYFQNKASLAEQMSKTQNQWRKASSRFIAGEVVCVMKPDKVLNTTNYMVYDSNHIPELGETARSDFEEDKNSFRVKPSKNILAFLRKRNLVHLKEQQQNQGEQNFVQKKSPKRPISPMHRMNMSCQLRRNQDESPFGRSRLIEIERVQNLSPDVRCTSPTFRNKRVTNYLRYKIGKS